MRVLLNLHNVVDGNSCRCNTVVKWKGRYMKPTEELKAEHKGILRMLRILDAVCERLDRGQEVDPKDLDDIVEFIRVFADKCHHGKEEDLLFPAMEREAGLSRQRGPLGRHARGAYRRPRIRGKDGCGA